MTNSNRCRAKNRATCSFHGTPTLNPFVAEHNRQNKDLKRNSNTFKAEKLAVKAVLALSENNETLSQKYVNQFCKLPELQKFLAFRNLTAEKTLQLFKDLAEKLKTEVGVENPKYVVSSDNKIGSDLEEKTTNTSIELKFGSSTDINSGMDSLREIIPADLYNIFPTNEDRIAWRAMYLEGKADEQLRQYHSKLALLPKKFEESPELFTLNEKAQHVLNSYYAGVNSQKEIDHIFNGEQEPRKIIRIFLQKDNSWERLYRPKIEKTDKWKMQQVLFSEDKKRLSFVFVSTNGWKITLRYNHKNNYVLNGEKVSAKQGLGSPSLNGWVTSPSSEEKIL